MEKINTQVALRRTEEIQNIVRRKPLDVGATPEWVTDTPDISVYELRMFSETLPESMSQVIQLTRGEYIELKRHLADIERLGAPPNTAARG